MVRVGFIPQLDEEYITYETKTIGAVTVEVPIVSLEQLHHITDEVKKASAHVRKKYTVSDVVSIVDEAVARWLDRDDPYRQKAEKFLPLITGYDAEMIRLGLTSYVKTFRKPQLMQFIVEDFGNPLILDDFQPRAKGGYAKALGPDLMTHVWAGNVPALPLWSLVASLLVKGGSIGKVPSAEPLFATLFARTLAEIDPVVARSIAIVSWQGGDEERERLVFQKSDLVIAYGSNESLQAIRKHVPITTRFLPYGHKMGIGFIGKESLHAHAAKQLAQLAAYDVMRYDQQGCYSPHIFFVEKGGRVTPAQFSEYVAYELEAFERRYPRRALSMAEETQLSAWKQKEEMQLFLVQDKKVFQSKTGAWAVVFETLREKIEPSPLQRYVRVVEVDTLGSTLSVLTPYRPFLQTAAVVAAPERLFQFSTALAEIGMTRVTSLGEMTSPQPGWHHDGTWSLLDLVRIVDIERSAEEQAEFYAPYRD